MGSSGHGCSIADTAGGWNRALHHGSIPQPEESSRLRCGLLYRPSIGKEIFEGGILACLRGGYASPHGILRAFVLHIVSLTGEIRKQTAHIRVAAPVWTLLRSCFACLQRGRALS